MMETLLSSPEAIARVTTPVPAAISSTLDSEREDKRRTRARAYHSKMSGTRYSLYSFGIEPAKTLSESAMGSFLLSWVTGSELLDSLDDAYLPVDGVAENPQRFLVAGTVVRRDGLGDAVEFDEDRSLLERALVGLRRHPAREEASARALQCGTRKLRIGVERLGVVNGTIGSNPIGFWHGSDFAGYSGTQATRTSTKPCL